MDKNQDVASTITAEAWRVIPSMCESLIVNHYHFIFLHLESDCHTPSDVSDVLIEAYSKIQVWLLVLAHYLCTYLMLTLVIIVFFLFCFFGI